MQVVEQYQQQLSIPIPIFPPFKLRSSLIDKDPVIWEYLLLDYITLFKKLLALVPYTYTEEKKGIPAPYILNVKTSSQLQIFIQTFLHESSLESNQVFSLGAINPNIRTNQHHLKLIVFQYLKTVNLVNLKIFGNSLWEFCIVYVNMADKYSIQGINQSFVTLSIIRKLIIGNIKSSYTSKSDDLSLVKSLHDHLGKLIASGKFKNEDFDVLYLLLGQRTKKMNTNNNKKNGNNNKKNVKISSNDNGEFSQNFVTKHWIEILEELYSGGTGVNAETCVKLMVMSFCSLTSIKIFKFLKNELEIDSLIRLRTVYPLIGKVILSKTFNDMNPDLKNMILPLFEVKKVKKIDKPTKEFDDFKIIHVRDMFPQLSIGQVKSLLVNKNDDVELIINELLEMELEDIANIEDYDVKQERKNKKNSKKKNKNEFEFKDQGKTYTVQMGKKESNNEIDEETEEELKKKNLQRALALLYEADEDEPDDTYIDNEITNSTTSNNSNSKMEEIENKLFRIYTTQREKLNREDRKSTFRNELCKETGWSNEQIEGWARMLDKSSSRFRNLEDKYLFTGGSLNKGLGGKTSTKWTKKLGDDDDDKIDNKRNKSKPKDKKVEQDSNTTESNDKKKNNDNFKAYMAKKQQQRQQKKK